LQLQVCCCAESGGQLPRCRRNPLAVMVTKSLMEWLMESLVGRCGMERREENTKNPPRGCMLEYTPTWSPSQSATGYSEGWLRHSNLLSVTLLNRQTCRKTLYLVRQPRISTIPGTHGEEVDGRDCGVALIGRGISFGGPVVESVWHPSSLQRCLVDGAAESLRPRPGTLAGVAAAQ
jgi:hypothetical protein